LPQATRGTQVLSSAFNGVQASSAFGDSSLLITLDTFTSDSRAENPSVDVSVRFTAAHDDRDASAKLEMAPESVTFAFVLTVGIGDEDGPLVGGVSGSMACCGAKVLAETEVK
jgi:hypothetical protein